jgi:hypothetical protein
MKLMLEWLRIGSGITTVIIATFLLVDTVRVNKALKKEMTTGKISDDFIRKWEYRSKRFNFLLVISLILFIISILLR